MTSQGNDVMHLMEAMNEIGDAFKLRIVAFRTAMVLLLLIALCLLTVGASFLAAASGAR